MTTAIIDYGSGNLHSALKAFERAAREAELPADAILTADPDRVAGADRIVLPGVGAYADCEQGLRAVDGMIEALHEVVTKKARPFLGICVGMQLMAERGLEYTTTQGFGWIRGDVVAIKPDNPDLKVPHMGWNTLDIRHDHALLRGIATGHDGLHAYFVHSYHMVPLETGDIVAQADYGGAITAMVARDTMVGTQFHPEKSQTLGLALIRNFLRWRP